MDIKLPTRSEIEKCFGNASFGSADPVQLVKKGLLKLASGYADGHTVTCILQELKLVKKNFRGHRALPKLTKYGGRVLFELYGRTHPKPADEAVALLNEALEVIDYLGDILNNHDMAFEEDEDIVNPKIERIRKYVEQPSPSGQEGKEV